MSPVFRRSFYMQVVMCILNTFYAMRIAHFCKDIFRHSKAWNAFREPAYRSLSCPIPLSSALRLSRHHYQSSRHPSQYLYVLQKRYKSTARPLPETSLSSGPTSTLISSNDSLPGRPDKPPSYELTFTCKPCGHRSSHTISKQGYHHGTVLITCSECKNRHVISDHLNIFADRSFTIEDHLKRKGELVKRGRLGGYGDVEFWDDGTSTERVGEKNKL